jgi:signal transduction histidine kinase
MAFLARLTPRIAALAAVGRGVFTPPRQDPETQRRWLVLTWVLTGTLLVDLVLGLAAVLLDAGRAIADPMLLWIAWMALLLMCVACLVLARRAQITPAAYLYLATLLALVTLLLARYGVNSEAPVFYLLPITIAALLLDTRGSLIAASISIAALLIAGMLQATGLLAPLKTDEHIQVALHVATYILVSGLVGLVVWFMGRQSADLYTIEVRRRRRAEQLGHISDLLSSALELNSALDLALEQLARVVPFDSASVILLDHELAVVRRARGFQAKHPEPLANLPALRQVLITREPLLILDTSNSPLWAPAAFGLEGSPIRCWIGAPLVVRGEAIGGVTADQQRPLSFDRDDLNALAYFAGHLAAAIENARLYQIERQRREELAALQQTFVQIGAEPDRQALLEHIVDEIARILRAPVVMVMVWDRDGRRLVVGAQRGVSDEFARSYSLPPASVLEQLHGLGGKELRPVYFADVQHQSPGDHDLLRAEDLQAELQVPLVVSSRLVGLLCLANRRETVRLFTERDYEVMNLFAAQAAVALQNVMLRETERRRVEEALALLELSRTLVSSLALDKIYTQVLSLAETLTGAVGAWLSLYNPDANVLEAVAARGWPGVPLDQHPEALNPWDSDTITWQAFESRRTVSIDVLLAYHDEAVAGGVHSIVVLPLYSQSDSLGVLGLYLPAGWQLPALSILATLANLTAVAIENARLYGQVRDYARSLENKVAERTEALRRQSEYTQATLHSVADAVVVLDERRELALINPAAERLRAQISDLERDQLVALIERLREESAAPGTLMLGGADWQVSVATLSGAGHDLGTVAVLHNVTRLRELDRLKSQFVSNVSHELRTPLTNIRLYLGLMRRGPTDRYAQYLDVLDRESTRLTRLIEDLLDLSRLESGTVRLNLEPLDAGEVAADVVVRLAALAHEHEVALTYDPAATALHVRADRSQLIQALVNLVGNAVNYTPHGGEVHVSVDPGGDGQAAPSVALSVRDTGRGIALEERARIFERFYRGEAAAAAGVPGTGLGLSIVAEIARLHGGRIEMESELGRGSVFRLILPRMDDV